MSLLQDFRQLTTVFRTLPRENQVEPLADMLGQLLESQVTVTGADGVALAEVGGQAWKTPSTAGKRAATTVLDSTIAELGIYAGDEQLGRLILTRSGQPLSESEQVLAEYAATLLGLVMHQEASQREAEATRRAASVRVALDALSYSEQAAAKELFRALDGLQGLVVTSHIADQMGITRSVIVNALRKLESAGVIETRSLGMKGTFIRVLNPLVPEAFQALQL